MIQISSAQLPAQAGDDRFFAPAGSVIVLDGATAHGPAELSPGKYVDSLGTALVTHIDEGTPLRDVLEAALRETIAALDLDEGSPYSPSSTVAIARVGEGSVDLLVLGDSTVVVGHAAGSAETLCDNRLDSLNLAKSGQYRLRLQRGAGYDETHRGILADLQQEQRRFRNRPGGYWIASTDPAAARNALTASFAQTDVNWIILATDGAADILAALGIPWHEISEMDSTALDDLMHRCHRWEIEADPDGAKLPRPKRHDDKTIAVIRMQ